jgi:hypothetical protein
VGPVSAGTRDEEGIPSVENSTSFRTTSATNTNGTSLRNRNPAQSVTVSSTGPTDPKRPVKLLSDLETTPPSGIQLSTNAPKDGVLLREMEYRKRSSCRNRFVPVTRKFV